MKTASASLIAQEEAVLREPAELYKFWIDGGPEWHFCDGDISVDYDGDTYLPAAISRSQTSVSIKFEETKLKITIPNVDQPIYQFVQGDPPADIWVSVNKIHRDQSPYETVNVFIGQVSKATLRGESVELDCIGFERFLNTQIPRYRYQPPCNNSLFDTFCTLSKSSYKVTATVTKVDNDTFSSATFGSYATNYFRFGVIEYTDGDGILHTMMIRSNSGNNIHLRYPEPNIPNGASVDCYPGCDKKINTCETKFSNLLNFFGHPYIPKENAFTRTGK